VQSPGADPADLRRPMRRPSADPAADPAADRRQLALNPLVGAAMCGVRRPPPTAADRPTSASRHRTGCRVHHNAPPAVGAGSRRPARGPRLPAPSIYTYNFGCQTFC
jgi:hypothetical protein